MTNDIQLDRIARSGRDMGKKRTGHAEDFESLLKRRTETYRAEKEKADAQRSRSLKTDSRNQPEKGIGKDMREDIGGDLRKDISRLEAEEEGSSRKTEDVRRDLVEGTQEGAQDISAPAYLLQEAMKSRDAAMPSLTGIHGQDAGSLPDEAVQAAAGQPLDHGPVDSTKRMTDDAVEEIPSLPVDTLKRRVDSENAATAPLGGEGGKTGNLKPEFREALLENLKDAGAKEDIQKAEILKKAMMVPENQNRMTEAVKNLEQGADARNTLSAMEKTMDLMREGRVGKKDDGEPETALDLEGLKGLASTGKAGESRMVQETQKPVGQMAADRNLELAATGIVHRVETLKDGDRTTIRVRLYPEAIGEMEITLSMEEGKLSGKILVENREMRQVFTERLSELNQTLRACHIDVARFEVGVGTGQHQDQTGTRDRRQTAYLPGAQRYGRETAEMEGIGTNVRETTRGIDLLA